MEVCEVPLASPSDWEEDQNPVHRGIMIGAIWDHYYMKCYWALHVNKHEQIQMHVCVYDRGCMRSLLKGHLALHIDEYIHTRLYT